jgi:type IV secretory pathway VirB10-like protein
MIKRTHRFQLAAVATLLLAAGLAHAQYAWIDEKGVRQFSDRPPPPATPASKILKAPGKRPVAELLKPDAPATAPEAGPAATPSAAAASTPPAKPTLADREADFRKRAQEAAKQEQQAAEEARQKQVQAEKCNSARRYKDALTSGMHIADTTANGAPTYMPDAERQKRLDSANNILAACR